MEIMVFIILLILLLGTDVGRGLLVWAVALAVIGVVMFVGLGLVFVLLAGLERLF